MRKTSCFILFCLGLYSFCQGQASADTAGRPDPGNYIAAVKDKAQKLEAQLDRVSENALARYRKQEEKIFRKLSRIDSLKAKEYIRTARDRYQALEARLKAPGKLKAYIPGLDSLSTTLEFLKGSGEAGKPLQNALRQVGSLKARLSQAEDIRAFLKERKEQLRAQLENLGFARELKKINKQAYYYAQQLKEYKEILNNPKKIERKALELLSKTKLWKDFFRKNSMLASLFRIPDPDEPLNMASLAGLQTRAQVSAQIRQIIEGGGPGSAQQFQQNIQQAQNQMQQMQRRVLSRVTGGPSSSHDIMPEGFKPNMQKTRSFFQRLEYGANFQSQKGNSFFPNSSDLGLSLGYKLNDKSIIGIGASYKLGFGRGWNTIKLTSEGLGLRSFIDWKLKKIFWISGGFEMNYNSAFSRFDVLNYYSAWQRSGLIGISKNIPVKSKLLGNTKVQVLWDFLSYEQVPNARAFVFRIGYSFK